MNLIYQITSRFPTFHRDQSDAARLWGDELAAKHIVVCCKRLVANLEHELHNIGPFLAPEEIA
jgi:hypothetical protein